MSDKWNATALVVDDRDPSIVYSGSWMQVTSTAEYDDTKSGAASAGMTATFAFNGIGVEVYGSVGSIDVYGRPVTTYEIDGLGSTSTTYQAQLIAPGYYTARTLFYRSAALSDGNHTIVITNMNGTAPTVFWLDYIVYTPSTDVAQPPSNSAASDVPSSTPSSSSTSGSSSLSASFTTSSNSVSTLQTSNPATPSSDAFSTSQKSRTPAGAIAGGVVGGVILAAILALLLWYCRRQRKGSLDDVRPFGSWRLGPAPSGTPMSEQMTSNASISGEKSYMLNQPSVLTSGGGPTMFSAQSLYASPATGSHSSFPAIPAQNVEFGDTSGSIGHQTPIGALSRSSGLATSGPVVDLGTDTLNGPFTQPGGSNFGGTSSIPPLSLGAESGSDTFAQSSASAALNSGSRVPGDVKHVYDASSPPLVRVFEDSGVRIPPSVVDVPPAYTNA